MIPRFKHRREDTRSACRRGMQVITWVCAKGREETVSHLVCPAQSCMSLNNGYSKELETNQNIFLVK